MTEWNNSHKHIPAEEKSCGNDMLLPEQRRAMAFTCNLTGIVLNLLLFLFKAAAGFISHSATITADAFNNLADAAASLLTMAGFYVAGFGAGKRHPFGHGRFEWIMGLTVSFSVIVMGAELIRTALASITGGVVSEIRPWMLLFLFLSILVKAFLFFYNKKIGKKIDSTALEAASRDCLGDAASTTAVLISAMTVRVTGWNIDGWCALAVSVIIIWGGIRTFFETLEKMMGTGTEGKIQEEIEAILLRDPVVQGVSDLRIHDYGLGNYMASARIFGKRKDAMVLLSRAEEISCEIYDVCRCACVVQPELLEEDETKTAAVAAAVNQFLLNESAKLVSCRAICCGVHTTVYADVVFSITMQKEEAQISREVSRIVEKLAPGWRTALTISIENDHLRMWRMKRVQKRNGVETR